MCNGECYISWIPTNIGYLSIGRLQQPDNANNNNVYTYSVEKTFGFTDTLDPKRKKEEIAVDYKLELKDVDEFPIEFDFSMNVKDASNTLTGLFNSKGMVYENGLVIFTCEKRNGLYEESKLENVPNTIFIIIKSIFHTDLHHNPLVDNVIPVIKIEKDIELVKKEIQNLFNNDNKINEDLKPYILEISKGIAEKIKQLEFESKEALLHTEIIYKYKILENYERAKGFYSYLKTFNKLFNVIDEFKKKRIFPDNVLDSLHSIASKVKLDLETTKGFLGTSLTILALFISSLILIKSNEFGIHILLKDYSVTDVKFTVFILFIFFLTFLVIIDFTTTQKIPKILLSKFKNIKYKIQVIEAKFILYYRNNSECLKLPFTNICLVNFIPYILYTLSGILLLFAIYYHNNLP